jgi:hypothetical protein
MEISFPGRMITPRGGVFGKYCPVAAAAILPVAEPGLPAPLLAGLLT